MWYNAPARSWEREALPIGNGRLGAMFFGGIALERIQFNEETLFSGRPGEIDEHAHERLPELRRLIAQGEYAQAERFADEQYLAQDGPDFGRFKRFGDVFVHMFDDSGRDYRRGLELEQGLGWVEYARDGVRYRREYLASHPDDVIAVRFSASAPGMLNADAFMPGGVLVDGDICLRGHTGYLGYEARVRVLAEGGHSCTKGDALCVRNADAFVLLLSAATEYRADAPGMLGNNCRAHNARALDAAQRAGYSVLRARHIADFSRLMGEFRLELPCGADDVPMDVRLADYARSDGDALLEKTLFDYGRYMLISSSRAGTLPANLQGVWNDTDAPEWGSIFCYNINLNMNYWCAEPTGLGECHGALIDFIASLVPSGERTARAYFDAPGWFASKKSDIWGFTRPYARAVYGLFMGGAGWLCRDVWDRYSYSRDLDYLRERGYPLLRGCAEFYSAFLVRDESGKLVCSPSTSPENRFLWRGERVAVCAACAMDQYIVQDLFTNYLRASEALGVDDALCSRVRAQLAALSLPRVTQDGRLMEWGGDFVETEPRHRHISPAYGVHPGEAIRDGELAQALRRTLDARGDGETGWSRAWKLCIWARLGDGARAYSILKGLISDRIAPNLFALHPPYQMDANMGYVAGVVELLARSYEDGTELLPALPPRWRSGSVRGLRVRGGLMLDFEWQDGRVRHVRARGPEGARVALTVNGRRCVATPDMDMSC